MLFIKNELITMLRQTLNISTTKDLKPLLEIYLALDKSIDRFQINSYSYVIKKLFETESILKNFADILQKHFEVKVLVGLNEQDQNEILRFLNQTVPPFLLRR